jgi:DNA-binding transcriptional ArsR family regulator
MTQLLWDCGTEYELFTSLVVLHRPVVFGVRPAWAAGVRSRLPQGPRSFLEKSFSFLDVPLAWLYDLPQSKDAASSIEELSRLPAADRLAALQFNANTPPEMITTCRAIASKGTWDLDDREILQANFHRGAEPPKASVLDALCRAWSDPLAFGENIVSALQTYYEVFFHEEESRLSRALQTSLQDAQHLSQELPLRKLMDELSHGIQFEEMEHLEAIILIPSEWVGPLIIYSRPDTTRMIVQFGNRQANNALAPADEVPVSLTHALKALGDPTRLLILRYLNHEPLTPNQIAERLRLRPPTVIHHLNILRLAGLVRITFLSNGERRYAARQETVADTITEINQFLKEDQ